MHTAKELLEKLRTGKMTCEQVVKMYIDRINTYQSKLNAVAEIDPAATVQARSLDTCGDRTLPLFGLPILIKDNIDVKGLHTTAGSAALTDNIADNDAPVVANLRKNGAIILGKANMTEFANYTTDNMPNGFSSHGGQVVNAYSPAMDPSGSSTGSAVAVSAGLCAAAIGTDTLFSVVGCATNNGVAGIKPPHGTLSVEGIIPICHTLDSAGPLARNIEDAILVYSGMRDEPLSTIDPLPVNKLRLAVNITGRENVSVEQIARYNTVLDALRNAGAAITEAAHPATRCHRAIMRCEFRHDMDEYLSGSNAARKTLSDIIEFYNANPEHMPYGITLLTDAMENASGNMDDAEYIEAMNTREELRRTMLDILGDCDACLMTGSTCLFHVCGLPSVALPMSMAEDGTPRGMILYGKDEQMLLSAAMTIEKYCPGITEPKL